MWQVTHRQPWLVVEFEQSMSCLGWTPRLGGEQMASSVLWREVRNEDLYLGFEVDPWLEAQTRALGHPASPCFLISRHIKTFRSAMVEVEGICAHAVATAGLGNAERVGQRRAPEEMFGTINLLIGVNRAMTTPAQLEALSLMAEARTLAMLDHAPPIWEARPTGTGTDCLCLASPPSGTPESYAGKHTALGEAIGAAALQAISAAILDWKPPS